jgi:thymidylate synthase
MQQYLDLMRQVRDNGARKDDRTGTGTLSVFGHPLWFELARNSLPMDANPENIRRWH